MSYLGRILIRSINKKTESINMNNLLNLLNINE